MTTFFLILIIVLFLLAISDLVVGVSNDAVNFLNSAIGAKAAPFKAIMAVAALGVLVGATFSSGMMEVARKGIFHPEYFYFSEIIILFLAVMITDVILLDTFNTFGMPTSTTVSIVFELLGAAVAISMVKILNDPNSLQLYEYINSAKALLIISGILLSVVVAFTCGAVVQYLSRLLFSFNYEKRMRQFGAIWAGLGVMAITYFMLVKGVKGTSFMNDEFKEMVQANTQTILLVSFGFWTALLYTLNRLFNINILQVLVLVGTFALAMAFSGNDLVNFIGVPLAGYNSYQLYLDAGATGADQFLMEGLAGKVPTPTLLLLLAGIIMVITLYTSKKAKSVVKTSLDLGRQDAGYERFSSSIFSRSLVRNISTLAKYANTLLPERWQSGLSRQFDQSPFIKRQVHLGKEAPSFDMIRASVTLVVASILIAIGTNLKLPLSTTYVTFMVFMGTSLADGAWGRESAVYRVSGVLSVIGGWFFTALSAFVVAFTLALVLHYGGIVAIVIILAIAGIIIFRTHRYHHKKMEEQIAFEKSLDKEPLSKTKVINLCNTQLKTFLKQYSNLTDKSLEALGQEDLTALTQSYRAFKPILKKIKQFKLNSSDALDKLPEHELEAGHLYILIVDYLCEMGKEVNIILRANMSHVDNNHKPLLPEQIEELRALHEILKEQYEDILELFKSMDQQKPAEMHEKLPLFMQHIRSIRKTQIKRIKKNEVGTRNSSLFLNTLGGFRNLQLFSSRIVKIFDELILNPAEEPEVIPKEIKKEIKEMKKETKNLASEELPEPQDHDSRDTPSSEDDKNDPPG